MLGNLPGWIISAAIVVAGGSLLYLGSQPPHVSDPSGAFPNLLSKVTLPTDPAKTITLDVVAQGSGSTFWPVPLDLTHVVVYLLLARATNGTFTTAFSAVESFKAGGGL